MKSTQIYLNESEYAALQEAATHTGSSMTAVVRDLIEEHLMGNQGPPTDLTDLIGAVATGEPTDIASQKNELLYEDLLADLRGHERSLLIAEP